MSKQTISPEEVQTPPGVIKLEVDNSISANTSEIELDSTSTVQDKTELKKGKNPKYFFPIPALQIIEEKAAEDRKEKEGPTESPKEELQSSIKDEKTAQTVVPVRRIPSLQQSFDSAETPISEFARCSVLQQTLSFAGEQIKSRIEELFRESELNLVRKIEDLISEAPIKVSKINSSNRLTSTKGATLLTPFDPVAGVERYFSQTKLLVPDWMGAEKGRIEQPKHLLAITFLLSLQISAIIFTLFCFINVFCWFLFIPYFIFILFDFETSQNGVGRRFEFLRKSKLLKWSAQYFPVRLHKTSELPPTKKYLFAYHPHGILGLGAVLSFATSACGVDKLFPGLTIFPLTLKLNFLIPFYRDFLLGLGKTSINFLSPTQS
jgi:hypothetical protein